MISVDDLLNGSMASPMVAPPLPSGNAPAQANGAGNPSSVSSRVGAAVGKTYASSNSAIVLVWVILLVLLILSHTFTFSLQE